MRPSDLPRLLTPQEVKHWIDEQRKIVLIDTLPGFHFQKKHLPGAINACVFEVVFIERVKTQIADKDAVILLYGSSSRAMDAMVAAEKLKKEGYHNLYALDGGIESWQEAHFPLEGSGIDEECDRQSLLQIENRTYIIMPEQSSIEWHGRNPTTTHYGTVPISCGELSVTDGIISGYFDIEMDLIVNKNLEGDPLQQVLLSHLKSDDFFLTSLFPQAHFSIRRGNPIELPYITSKNYSIAGELELRGVRAEQDFLATLSMAANKDLAMEAHFDIDRTKWGIIYGSARFFEHLGMHLVFDHVSIQLRIVAIQKKA